MIKKFLLNHGIELSIVLGLILTIAADQPLKAIAWILLLDYLDIEL